MLDLIIYGDIMDPNHRVLEKRQIYNREVVRMHVEEQAKESGAVGECVEACMNSSYLNFLESGASNSGRFQLKLAKFIL